MHRVFRSVARSTTTGGGVCRGSAGIDTGDIAAIVDAHEIEHCGSQRGDDWRRNERERAVRLALSCAGDLSEQKVTAMMKASHAYTERRSIKIESCVDNVASAEN